MNGVENRHEVSAIHGLKSELLDTLDGVRSRFSLEGRNISQRDLRFAAAGGGTLAVTSLVAGIEYVSSNSDVLTDPRKAVGVGIYTVGTAFGGHIVRSAGRALSQLRNRRENRQAAAAKSAMNDLESYTDDRRFDVN